MATPDNVDRDVIEFSQFLGLRNNVGPESFELSDLAEALNVDITDALRLQRRKGYARVVTGSYHSFWASGDYALVVSGSTLYRYVAASDLRVLRTDLIPDRPLSFSLVGDRVYYSNGLQTGCITRTGHRTWGLVVPFIQPTAQVIGGSLRPGRYQFVVTFLRDDGQESGALRAGVIELPTLGGIGFSGIPVSVDPTVTQKNLYVSPTDGDMLYRVQTLRVAETTAVHISPEIGDMPLKTQFLSAPPAGDYIAEYNGRVYVASGNTLYYSNPYAYELFDLRLNLHFASTVTMIAPVRDGIYIGTEDAVAFLAGEDPAGFSYDIIASYGVIPRTLAYGDTKDLPETPPGYGAFFASKEGICVGLDGGSLRNLTNTRYQFPTTQRGAGIVRKIGGMSQYLAILEGAETPGNTAF